MKKLVCEYCGKEKEEISFMIGASLKPDWCMLEGTGKITCPECYKIAAEEANNVIDNYIKGHNQRIKKEVKK